MSNFPVKTTFTFLHASQPDVLTPGFISSNVLKADFDSQAQEMLTFVNSILAVLTSVTPGASGADNISSAPISGVAGGVASNVYAQISDLKAQLTGIILNQIPDGTLTLAKLTQSVSTLISSIPNMQNNIYELSLQSYFDGKLAPKNGMQYDGFSDSTKTNAFVTFITANVAAGAVTCTVNDASQLNNNEQIAIYDGTNYEERIITKSGNVLSWTGGLTNSYTANTASVARTSSVIDTVNKWCRVGNASQVLTNTAVIVAAGAFDTSGNNGDKLVRTANGNVITIEVNGTTIQVQKSIDNQVSFQPLCTITGAQVGAAITYIGANNVTILWNTTTIVYSNTFDVTTVTNTDQNANKVIVDNGMTSITNNVSIKTGPDGMPQATWSGIHPSFPNSKNPRYSKATTTSVTVWATPTQITSTNTAGTDNTNPCIVVKSNNYPIIFYSQVQSSSNAIIGSVYNGSTFGTYVVYGGSTYAQANPCARVASNGRIWCAWQGLDATDTAQNNIRYSYSDDGGPTWLTPVKLTSGNTYAQNMPTVSIDKNNNVYVLWHAPDAVSAGFYNVFRNVWTGSAFQGVVKLTTNTTASAQNPSSIDNNTLDFNLQTPPMIYTDNQATAVKFSGTVGTTTPVKKTAYYSKRISYPDANKTAKLWLTRNITISTTPSIAISANAVSATLTSVTSLAIGDTIDFYNSASTNYTRERRAITGIAGNVVSWTTGLTNGYSTANTVARVDEIPTLFIGLTTDIESFATMSYSRTTVNADGTVEDTYDYTATTAGTDVVLKITQTRNDTTLVNYVKKYGMALSA